MDTFSNSIISLEAPDKIESKFDYGTVSSAEGEALRGHAQAILTTIAVARKTTVSWALTIGRELAAARERLSRHGNGTFGEWCRQECGLSRTTAFRFMRVQQVLGDCSSVEQFDLAAVYAMASKECPDDVRSELIRRAESGEHVREQTVRDAVSPGRTVNDGRKGKVRSIAASDPRETSTTLDQLRDEVRQLIDKWERRSVPRHEIAQVLRESMDLLSGDSVADQPPGQVAEIPLGNRNNVEDTSAHPPRSCRVGKAKPCSSDRACPGSGSGAECGHAPADNSMNESVPPDVPLSQEVPQSAPRSAYPSFVHRGVDGECHAVGSLAFFRPVGTGDGGWLDVGGEARAEICQLWKDWNDAQGMPSAVAAP